MRSSKEVVGNLIPKHYKSLYQIAQRVYPYCKDTKFEHVLRRWSRWAKSDNPPTAQMKLDLNTLTLGRKDN